jgi:hypothetical protein
MSNSNRRGRRRTDQIFALGALLLLCGDRGQRVPTPGVLQRVPREGGTVQHGQGQRDKGGEEKRRTGSQERVFR